MDTDDLANYTALSLLLANPMCPGSSGVEQRIENPRVGGSNPPPGTIYLSFQNDVR